MQTIEFLQPSDEYQIGDVATVENNAAHRYIDSGKARLKTITTYENRMIDQYQAREQEVEPTPTPVIPEP